MSTTLILVMGLLGATEPDVARQLDLRVSEGWKTENIQPTAVCDDATILRRVWLDLAGRVPPFAEANKLAKSGKPQDRAAVIEKLLDSPEFAAYWSRQWAEDLLGQRPLRSGSITSLVNC